MREEVLYTGRRQRLHGRLWRTDREMRGVVIVVHGLGDHGGRYKELAQALCDAGWAVFAFDLIGHGRSPGSRGRAKRYDGLLSDVAHARKTVADKLPLGQVLLGHSMGGNLALNYLLRREQFERDTADSRVSGRSKLDEPLGLALCAPMLLPPSPPPRPHIFAAWVTGHLFPWVRLGKPVDTSHLTQDPVRAEAIREDPLMHSRFTVYLATQLLSQGRWALDQARNVNVPTLIMYGEDDQLIDRSACEHASIRIGADADLVAWPKMRHDLFHETERAQITARLIEWLEQLPSADPGSR